MSNPSSGPSEARDYTPAAPQLWMYDFLCAVLTRASRWRRALARQIDPTAGDVIADIGCGTGEFLHEMLQNGWAADGVEKDKSAAGFARQQHGLNIKNEELTDCDYPEKSFDVITMWHVLEHLDNPNAVIAKIKLLLKNDGLLLIALPNIASPDAKFYQNNWVALDAPRHVTHFTGESMDYLCSLHGLRLVKSHQLVLDAFFNCLMSEKIIIKRKQNSAFVFPIYLIRALLIAVRTIFLSSAFAKNRKKSGSSMLYFIKKSRD